MEIIGKSGAPGWVRSRVYGFADPRVSRFANGAQSKSEENKSPPNVAGVEEPERSRESLRACNMPAQTRADNKREARVDARTWSCGFSQAIEV
jgi:hypothetical protein